MAEGLTDAEVQKEREAHAVGLKLLDCEKLRLAEEQCVAEAVAVPEGRGLDVADAETPAVCVASPVRVASALGGATLMELLGQIVMDDEVVTVAVNMEGRGAMEAVAVAEAVLVPVGDATAGRSC